MVSAGDVERFVYCPHNWFLARQGIDVQDEGSRRGVAQHARAGAALGQVEAMERERRSGLKWALRLMMATASVVLLTLETIYFKASEPHHYILLVTAVVLVVGSIALLVIALDAARRARALQLEYGLLPGDAIHNDMGGDGDLLEDPEWGLSGTPDYVMQAPGAPVPVEVKTGNTPPQPHESHIMQLAAYMRLLEAAGTPPRYGLITYPDRADRIEWDSDVQVRLRSVLARIDEAAQAGRADRDHEHPGRCRGCARRDFCEQRLA